MDAEASSIAAFIPQIRASANAGGAKNLVLDDAPGVGYGVGGPSQSTPISGTGAFAGSPPSYHGVGFDVSLTGAVPGESIQLMGVTVLSKTVSGVPVNFNNVTATALLSNGGTITATRVINEGVGLGDTFFGVVAPAGLSIERLTIVNNSTSSNQSFMWVDDIGFITRSIPEPGMVTGLAGFALMALHRRRRA